MDTDIPRLLLTARRGLLLYEIDSYIAVVAVDGERFCAALLIFGQVAVSLLYCAGYGEIVPTAQNRARNVAVFGRKAY